MAPFRPPSTTYMPKPELPPHLQSLFNPRPPLPYVKVPIKPKCRPYNGLADYVDMFEEGDPPPKLPSEGLQHQKLRDKKEIPKEPRRRNQNLHLEGTQDRKQRLQDAFRLQT